MVGLFDQHLTTCSGKSAGEFLARINIEDCWWTDPRRERLGELLGSMLMADAVVIRAWRIAQEFWGKDRALVPKDVFATIQEASKLVQAHLAEEREGGFYVRGSSQYLDWIIEQKQKASAGGKKSAQRPRDAKGRLLKKSKQKSNEGPSVSKPIQVSDSGSISGSSSNSVSSSEVLHPPLAEVSTKGLRSEIWKKYSDAYFARYGTEPVRNAAVNSKIKLLSERLGDEAKDVVEFYVSHNNAFYVRATHPIGLCVQDAEGLRTQWATGRMTSVKEASQADASTALASQLKRIREGVI